jgi:hypothetical protein
MMLRREIAENRPCSGKCYGRPEKRAKIKMLCELWFRLNRGLTPAIYAVIYLARTMRCGAACESHSRAVPGRKSVENSYSCRFRRFATARRRLWVDQINNGIRD